MTLVTALIIFIILYNLNFKVIVDLNILIIDSFGEKSRKMTFSPTQYFVL